MSMALTEIEISCTTFSLRSEICDGPTSVAHWTLIVLILFGDFFLAMHYVLRFLNDRGCQNGLIIQRRISGLGRTRPRTMRQVRESLAGGETFPLIHPCWPCSRNSSLHALFDKVFQFFAVQDTVDHALGLVLEAEAIGQAKEREVVSDHFRAPRFEHIQWI